MSKMTEMEMKDIQDRLRPIIDQIGEAIGRLTNNDADAIAVCCVVTAFILNVVGHDKPYDTMMKQGYLCCEFIMDILRSTLESQKKGEI